MPLGLCWVAVVVVGHTKPRHEQSTTVTRSTTKQRLGEDTNRRGGDVHSCDDNGSLPIALPTPCPPVRRPPCREGILGATVAREGAGRVQKDKHAFAETCKAWECT